MSEGRTDDAWRFFEHDLAIFRRRSYAAPGRADLASDLSISFERLGNLAKREGRTDDARRFFEDDLAIRRRRSYAEQGRANLASDLSIKRTLRLLFWWRSVVVSALRENIQSSSVSAKKV